METVCPNCGCILRIQSTEEFSSETCKHCLKDELLDNFDLSKPPDGCWFHSAASGWELGASRTDVLGSVILFLFMLFWSGMSLGGIYGSQLAQREFSPGLSLFGIPFILGSFGLFHLWINAMFGEVVLTLSDGRLTVFSGVGSWGKTQIVDWSNVHDIVEGHSHQNSDNETLAIHLMGQERTIVGTMLTNDRRYYLVQAMRKLKRETK